MEFFYIKYKNIKSEFSTLPREGKTMRRIWRREKVFCCTQNLKNACNTKYWFPNYRNTSWTRQTLFCLDLFAKVPIFSVYWKKETNHQMINLLQKNSSGFAPSPVICGWPSCRSFKTSMLVDSIVKCAVQLNFQTIYLQQELDRPLMHSLWTSTDVSVSAGLWSWSPNQSVSESKCGTMPT